MGDKSANVYNHAAQHPGTQGDRRVGKQARNMRPRAPRVGAKPGKETALHRQDGKAAIPTN